MMDIIEDTLTTVSFAEEKPKFVLWNTPFYDIKNLKDLPAFHQDFKKLKLPIFSPLLPPKLPELKMDLAYGALPTIEDLKKFMNDAPGKSKGDLISLKKTSAENLLQKEGMMTSGKLIEDLKFPRSWEKSQESSSYKNTKRKRPENSAFITQKGNVVGGGTELVLNALAAYLRYLEGTARDDFQEVHEKLRNAESREGTSFGALFRPALDLGIISRRKVYYEAIKYERERNGGFISPFGFSASTIAAAVNTVCSMEWHFLMALKSQTFKEGAYSIKIWRWKGYLIQYTVAGHDGPAVLLVHGFGAFLEHYRDNIYRIAEGGNQVWAITLLGFGKSEKPNILYTELMWAELLRDFIIDVVGQPVHLVGNSIGGYFVAMVAGLWPALTKSVILLNSAGNIIPGYSSVPYTKERRTSLAAWMGARLLLLYLKLRIKNIVKNCYPKRTDQADDWLINEMLRASYDPGVLVVLESMFSFDLSVPLNYLLDGFERRVLVIQGMQDPLADSKSKLSMLKEHCQGIVAREIDAGHCPHDEIPEEVNSFIREWLVIMESKILVGKK